MPTGDIRKKVERVNDQRNREFPKGGVAPFLERQRELCMKDGIHLELYGQEHCCGVQSQCTLGVWLRLCKGESAT